MNDLDSLMVGSKRARVEIIPLIDVVFFLLATFVLFTLSLNKIGSITVPMPATDIVDHPDENGLSIQASADGTYYWKLGTHGAAELISAEELRPRLERYRDSVPVPRVFVRGDDRAKFGAAIKIFDVARAIGIQQIAMETVPSRTGG